MGRSSPASRDIPRCWACPLHHARRLLRDERLTVAAVAARVGYSSDVAFAATFRRVVGIPPAEWRRRAKH